MKTIDLSGFGGGYEACCQAMLFAGMKWLKEHPEFSFINYKGFSHIFGVVITPKETKAEELEEVLQEAAQHDMTGAQHQAVISHLALIHKKGYDAWLEEAKKHGREIIEVDEDENQRVLDAATKAWQEKLAQDEANGVDREAEFLKQFPKGSIIDLNDPDAGEQLKKAIEGGL